MSADPGSLATIVRDGRPGPVIEVRDFKRAFARFQDQVTDRGGADLLHAAVAVPGLLFGVALGFFGQQGLISDAARFTGDLRQGADRDDRRRHRQRSRARRRTAAPR